MEKKHPLESSCAQHPALTITALLGEKRMEALLHKIAGATDLAVALADYRGDECAHINCCNFCRSMRAGKGPVCTAASAANAFGIAQACVTEKPFIYFCPYGLMLMAVPIIVHGQYLGGFIAGQVRCSDAPADTVHLKNILPHDRNFLNHPGIRREFDAIPVLPYQKFLIRQHWNRIKFPPDARMVQEVPVVGQNIFQMHSVRRGVAAAHLAGDKAAQVLAVHNDGNGHQHESVGAKVDKRLFRHTGLGDAKGIGGAGRCADRAFSCAHGAAEIAAVDVGAFVTAIVSQRHGQICGACDFMQKRLHPFFTQQGGYGQRWMLRTAAFQRMLLLHGVGAPPSSFLYKMDKSSPDCSFIIILLKQK